MIKFNYTFTKFVIFFSISLVVGLFLSNKIIFVVSLLIILFFILGLFINEPNDISIKRMEDKRNVITNTEFINSVEITINKGFGLILLGDLLPHELDLVSGSNYMVVFKGLKPLKVRMTYGVCAYNACFVELDSFFYESHHFFELSRAKEKRVVGSQTITFSPNTMDYKDIRNAYVLANLFNYQFTKSKFGMPTLEFKQLRAYTVGDSVKYINWKATARNIDSKGEYYPIVNEFFKEGMYNVWFLLDFSIDMLYGSNVKNVFNYSLDTIFSLSEYYLKKNANVAFCTFGRNSTFLYPDSGKNQYYKLLKQLRYFTDNKNEYLYKVKKDELTLKETVFKYKKYFQQPFFIIFTRIIPKNFVEIDEGIRECLKYVQKNTRRKFPVMVVNVNGHLCMNKESDAGILATDFLKLRDKYLIQNSLKDSVIWMDWDPFCEDFYSVLKKRLQN